MMFSVGMGEAICSAGPLSPHPVLAKSANGGGYLKTASKLSSM